MLPKTAGVYIFKQKKDILYIGKAINIKNRVKNHFRQPNYRDNLFINQVNKVGFLKTNSEIEALILEANLIKKYQPKYNVMWRDDKNYFYVAIVPMAKPPRIHDKVGTKNDAKLPYIYITHQPQPRTENIGPFTEGTALKKTLRFLRRAFPYYSVKKHSKLKCTYCHLDLCPGPYEQLFAPRPDGLGAPNAFGEYKKNIKKLILILKGKRNAVLKSLKKEMKQLSREREFEKAGKIRDKINALQQIMEHTRVINAANTVVINHARAENMTSPYWLGTEKILKEILGIKKSITRMECYDVSNIQGKQATGSMVVFINNKPDKNQYRKFRIRIKNEPNDIAMLKETISRRLQHSEWPYPEIMLIDGGKGQLNAALEIKNSKNYLKILKRTLRGASNKNLKIISIAKGRQELFIEGKNKPIPLKNLPREIFNLILQLDAEAHRFAITYHKKLRKKNLLK